MRSCPGSGLAVLVCRRLRRSFGVASCLRCSGLAEHLGLYGRGSHELGGRFLFRVLWVGSAFESASWRPFGSVRPWNRMDNIRLACMASNRRETRFSL
jgi:hypothetical protein